MTLDELLHYTKSKAEWHYAEGKRLKSQATFKSISRAIVHIAEAKVYSEMGFKLFEAMYGGENAPIPSPE